MPPHRQTIEKTIQVYPKQLQFMESTALWRSFVGGVGSGKSFVGSLDLIRRAKPGRLYLVSAPTYTMLEDSSFRSFLDVARRLGVVNDDGIKRSQPPHINLLTGAEIIFRSTDKPDSLRGPNLSGVWMDEASLMDREAFDILIGRLREDGEMGWGTATFTPKGKLHWTYKKFGVGAPDTSLVHARSDENPFLPPAFVKKIREQYTSQQIKQELGGLFVDSGGNYYFPDSWPKYIDTGDSYRINDASGQGWRHVLKADCSRLLTLDWAMGKPKKDAATRAASTLSHDDLKGDCTAFVVADMSYDADGLLFLLDAVNRRIPLAQNAPALAAMCRKWKPLVVSGDDDNLSETMLLECRRYNDIPSIKSMGIKSRNKVTRSQAAIVRADRGKIYLPERRVGLSHLGQDEWVGSLCDQLASFTGADGEPDDLADAVSILGRLADEFRPGEDTDDFEPTLGSGGYSRESLYG